MQEAQVLYEQQDYQAVQDILSQLNGENAAVVANLGHCYFYQKDFVNALICYRKAQKDTTVRDYRLLNQYIDQIRQQTGSPESNHDLSFSEQIKNIFLLKIFNNKRVLVIAQIIGLAFWIILLTLLIYSLIKRRYYAMIFQAMLLGIIAMVLWQIYILSGSHGVVIKNSLLRYGPGNNFHGYEKVKPLDEILMGKAVQDHDDAWINVVLVRDPVKKGWINRGDVEIY